MLLKQNSSLRDDLKLFAQNLKPYTSRKRSLSLEQVRNEVLLYSQDSLLQSKRDIVINYYWSLSIETLTHISSRYNLEKNIKFDGLISGHESLILKLLNNTHNLPCIQQLLIGGSHSDFYIPKFHLSIEPSSERYFSTSERHRAEAISEFERAKMSKLVTWRTEDYKRTSRDLKSIIKDFEITRPPLNPSEIKQNMFVMAVHTLPRFIPYKNFLYLMDQQLSTQALLN